MSTIKQVVAVYFLVLMFLPVSKLEVQLRDSDETYAMNVYIYNGLDSLGQVTLPLLVVLPFLLLLFQLVRPHKVVKYLELVASIGAGFALLATIGLTAAGIVFLSMLGGAELISAQLTYWGYSAYAVVVIYFLLTVAQVVPSTWIRRLTSTKT